MERAWLGLGVTIIGSMNYGFRISVKTAAVDLIGGDDDGRLFWIELYAS